MSDDAGSTSPGLARLRVEYSRRSLSEKEVNPDPLKQFATWFGEAVAAEAREANAMTLATCSRDGVPSARVVLLKGADAGGFVFFTNYRSRKSRELEENPRAALVFWWPELERQVRIEGEVQKTGAAESDQYFSTRPPASRLGAAASPQSDPIDSREALEARVEALRRRYPDGDVPRPLHWGGFRLCPRRIEFWQGRPSRLHDRLEYSLDDKTSPAPGWVIRRLAP